MTTTALGGVIKLKYTVQKIKHVRLWNAPFFFCYATFFIVVCLCGLVLMINEANLRPRIIYWILAGKHLSLN